MDQSPSSTTRYGLDSGVDRSNSVSPPRPPSVIECFEQQLPNLNEGSESQYGSVGASGSVSGVYPARDLPRLASWQPVSSPYTASLFHSLILQVSHPLTGSSIANAIEPKILRCKQIDHLTELANRALQAKRVLTTPSGNPRPGTSRCIASDFNSWDKWSEQDIASASNVYIMEPIHEILKVLYPDGWVVSAECTDAGLSKVSWIWG
ncbi:hypothetical protein CC86DRAFT_90319 [Ophiobolus disseminans]|uniref:Uncharacterized protein n=1 Tax=Ophiobolus disseminans TaxID=1469910 RepID=A0A6A7AGT8_9PLEO|nr:hypothetical protein CC86DRAFT_90319 [Ophiobolus disseminans]